MTDFFMWHREVNEEDDFILLKVTFAAVKDRTVQDTFDTYSKIYVPEYRNVTREEIFMDADEVERENVDEFWTFVQKYAGDNDKVRFITVGLPSSGVSLYLSCEHLIRYTELNDHALNLTGIDNDYINVVLSNKRLFKLVLTEMSFDDMIDNYYHMKDLYNRKLNTGEIEILGIEKHACSKIKSIETGDLNNEKCFAIAHVMKGHTIGDKKILSLIVETISNALDAFHKEQGDEFNRLHERLEELIKRGGKWTRN